MQCWDITLEAVSLRNNAANRRVKENDTSCCLRAGALTQPCTSLEASAMTSWPLETLARFKLYSFPSQTASFCSWKFVRCCCSSCVHVYMRQPCITGRMKWHIPCEVPEEYCSKFWTATGMFPRLIWLLSPVEGELELFWIILCQISRLTKWIWLTYEKWINPCFIPNGSSFSSDDCKFHYFGLEHLQCSWKQFLTH